jgi:FtsZ-interacting cell division protein YlmF
MSESNVALIVAAWGPAVAFLLSILLAVLLTRNIWASRLPAKAPRENHRVSYIADDSKLSLALDSAARLNGYSVHSRGNPAVYLEDAARFTPHDYESSARDIIQNFREGRVVTIDLSKIDSHQGARLVDFCSGIAAINSAWIFRVTDTVIVISPTAE